MTHLQALEGMEEGGGGGCPCPPGPPPSLPGPSQPQPGPEWPKTATQVRALQPRELCKVGGFLYLGVPGGEVRSSAGQPAPG